ncbi:MULTISPECIES: histone deacetylase family protein [Methylosinus]|uniref:Acetoin utilization protein n=1 Tax=Methylosinus trichosporium (strain ATCC 35070 / NCIMB 11131 / UNIQEM 75 / OB3b) TaxID=595536 RepID=A0A2D2D486_METT3|nr:MULTISPECIES: histone deacetylase family protein [Methylosinus]ATQ69820.1 acetoin utilization protein [Methylosinus trichosporium OB3b]
MLTRRDCLLGAAALVLPAQAQGATLLVSHLSGLAHEVGAGRPDQPQRLAAIASALAAPRFSALRRAEAPAAAREAILRVHAPALLERLERAAPQSGLATLGPDIAMSPGTLKAALHAAGGAVLAVDEVMRGAATNAFVAMRPPGHHATREAALGFCFLNNAAVAARHALAAHGAEHVAIVDFDVHHGNGLQEIFWDARDVLYCSTHQTPLYPGTGARSERGAHDNIVNAPLAKGDDGARFAEAWREILPRVDAFAPDILLICAGFDGHLHDPLGGLRLQRQDFAELTLRLMEIAARRCGGRIVSLLEGGYRPEDLAACVAAHVGALSGA